MSRLPIACTLALLALPTLAAADVLVVDPGGAGDHLGIQAAVDAAVDGDLILIRSGVYGAVTITGKGLSLVEDELADARIDGGVRIQNTLETHVIVLDGLTIEGSYFAPGGMHDALNASIVRGPLRVQDCELQGADGLWNETDLEEGGEAAKLAFVLDASFTDCILQGGEGGANYNQPGSFGIVNRAGHGLSLSQSTVSVHDSTVTGGDGFQPDFSDLSYGGMAGHGAYAIDSQFYAAGSSLTGGLGGTESFQCLTFPGGDGVRGMGALTSIVVLDSTLAGGPTNTCGSDPGLPSTLAGGAGLNTLPGTSRSFTIATPLRAGTEAPLTVDGVPGDVAWLLISFTQGRRDVTAALGGPLLVGTPLAVPRRFLGNVPANGSFSTPLAAPAVPAGQQHVTLSLQLLTIDPMNQAWLGNPQSWTSLDPSL